MSANPKASLPIDLPCAARFAGHACQQHTDLRPLESALLRLVNRTPMRPRVGLAGDPALLALVADILQGEQRMASPLAARRHPRVVILRRHGAAGRRDSRDRPDHVVTGPRRRPSSRSEPANRYPRGGGRRNPAPTTIWTSHRSLLEGELDLVVRRMPARGVRSRVTRGLWYLWLADDALVWVIKAGAQIHIPTLEPLVAAGVPILFVEADGDPSGNSRPSGGGTDSLEARLRRDLGLPDPRVIRVDLRSAWTARETGDGPGWARSGMGDLVAELRVLAARLPDGRAEDRQVRLRSYCDRAWRTLDAQANAIVRDLKPPTDQRLAALEQLLGLVESREPPHPRVVHVEGGSTLADAFEQLRAVAASIRTLAIAGPFGGVAGMVAAAVAERRAMARWNEGILGLRRFVVGVEEALVACGLAVIGREPRMLLDKPPTPGLWTRTPTVCEWLERLHAAIVASYRPPLVAAIAEERAGASSRAAAIEKWKLLRGSADQLAPLLDRLRAAA